MCGVRVSIENPLTSLLWSHREVQRWIRDFGITVIETHYCQFGAAWMKPTQIAASYEEIKGASRLCGGGHAHLILRGKTAEGGWKTTLAASYPMELCRVWASCCTSKGSGKQGTRGPQLPTIPEHVGSSCCVRGWDPIVPVESRVEPLPDSMLIESDYQLLYNHAWLHAEPIHQLEARAAVKCIQHASRTPACRQKRLLVLNDNMAVVMAMNKGRCRDFLLLRLTRKVCAYVLAHRIHARFRYVESKRNVADGPTRPDTWRPEQRSEVLGQSAPDPGLRQQLPAQEVQPRGLAQQERHM